MPSIVRLLSDLSIREAMLTDQQLVVANCLTDAKMVDGKQYDGRFNLSNDFNDNYFIKYEGKDSSGIMHVQMGRSDIAIPLELEDKARWYGVTLEEYLAGQEWAREHLADLRRSAGLDSATGLPVEPTNGIEPQPAAAPALPAPCRNGHKASMVAHRVQR